MDCKAGSSVCGRGIFVTDNIAEIRSLNFGDSNWQVSEYIDRPLLMMDTNLTCAYMLQ